LPSCMAVVPANITCGLDSLYSLTTYPGDTDGTCYHTERIHYALYLK
jgi:hypothetical protein